MAITRRSFLKASSYTLAATSLGSMSALLTSLPSQAAQTDGYKAMVCLFFLGGMDNYDTIIPYDTNGYQRWAEIRNSIISKQSTPRTREALLPITPTNSQQFGDRQFAIAA